MIFNSNRHIKREKNKNIYMKYSIILIFIIASLITQAQVSVGTPSANSTSSAQLEIVSNLKGFLPPRMTQQQRNAIVNPAQGLMVYCSNCGSVGENQVFDGENWTNLNGDAPLPVGANLDLPNLSTFPIQITHANSTNTKSYPQKGSFVTGKARFSIEPYGGTILYQGICWSTQQNPTLANEVVIGKPNTDLEINNLQISTTYYARAFAVTASGISYGNQIDFYSGNILLGDYYAGGIVSYLDQNNFNHGIVLSFYSEEYDYKNGYNDWIEYPKRTFVNYINPPRANWGVNGDGGTGYPMYHQLREEASYSWTNNPGGYILLKNPYFLGMEIEDMDSLIVPTVSAPYPASLIEQADNFFELTRFLPAPRPYSFYYTNPPPGVLDQGASKSWILMDHFGSNVYDFRGYCNRWYYRSGGIILYYRLF